MEADYANFMVPSGAVSAHTGAMSEKPSKPPDGKPVKPEAAPKPGHEAKIPPAKVKEIGGPEGPEPTRYGDWERKGRVSDF